jgi:hypothetical protein
MPSCSAAQAQALGPSLVHISSSTYFPSSLAYTAVTSHMHANTMLLVATVLRS